MIVGWFLLWCFDLIETVEVAGVIGWIVGVIVTVFLSNQSFLILALTGDRKCSKVLLRFLLRTRIGRIIVSLNNRIPLHFPFLLYPIPIAHHCIPIHITKALTWVSDRIRKNLRILVLFCGCCWLFPLLDSSLTYQQLLIVCSDVLGILSKYAMVLSVLNDNRLISFDRLRRVECAKLLRAVVVVVHDYVLRQVLFLVCSGVPLLLDNMVILSVWWRHVHTVRTPTVHNIIVAVAQMSQILSLNAMLDLHRFPFSAIRIHLPHRFYDQFSRTFRRYRRPRSLPRKIMLTLKVLGFFADPCRWVIQLIHPIRAVNVKVVIVGTMDGLCVIVWRVGYVRSLICWVDPVSDGGLVVGVVGFVWFPGVGWQPASVCLLLLDSYCLRSVGWVVQVFWLDVVTAVVETNLLGNVNHRVVLVA